MYILSFNKFDNEQEAVSFMQQYSFATIVTVNDGIPTATHLPFLVQQVNGQIILSSHFAKANPQAADIENCRALIIFTEPHAYISPKHYEKELSVPTWNYLAVHAYGTFSLLDGEENKSALLKNTIEYYEADYLKQWDNMPDDYKQKMMNGIIAFQVIVDDLQAKKKISQNRSQMERDNIIEAFDHSADVNEREIARYMKDLK